MSAGFLLSRSSVDGWISSSRLDAEGWLHIDLNAVDDRKRLSDAVPDDVMDALAADETRPRVLPLAGGLLIVLRGVNLNPGNAPDDMVSLRIWMQGDQLVTATLRNLVSMSEVVAETRASSESAPKVDAIVVAILERMFLKVSDVVQALQDRLDHFEESVLTQSTTPARGELLELRRQIINLHRFLAPQRDVTEYLAANAGKWTTSAEQFPLKEIHDRSTRYVEDLGALRERSVAVQDELANMLNEKLNRNLYLLALISAILLPLGFLTGLLGINVGGMPGVEDPLAFWWVVLLVIIVGAAEFALLRVLKWL